MVIHVASCSRSLTRSPSPKIAFTTLPHIASNGNPKRRSGHRQRGPSSIVLDAAKLADVDEALERALNNDGHANSIARPDKR